MSTFSDIADEVKTKLAGYTLNQDRMTYVKNPTGITNAGTAIIVGSVDNYAKGVIEIEEELILIDTYDMPNTTLNAVPGFGRGFRGTTAVAHPVYAPIVITPAFPRVTVKQAINDVISGVFPKLFAVKTIVFPYSNVTATYALPPDCKNVLGVSWRVIGPAKYWKPIKRYRVDNMAYLTEFGTGNTISIFDAVQNGVNIQVTYSAQPAPLSANTDVFANVTGLPDSCKDVIVLGACSRMLAFVDAGRINVTSAESDLADSKIPTSAGMTLGKFVYALFQQRLAEEASRLISTYSPAPHYIS